MGIIMLLLGLAFMIYSTTGEGLDKFYVSGQVWLVGSIIVNVLT